MTDFKAISRISTWEKFSKISAPLILEICQAYEMEKAVSKIMAPSCFGSNPGAQAQAENDCRNCSHEPHCLPQIEVSFHPESDVGRAQATRSAFNKQEGGDHYRAMKSQPFGFVRDNNIGHAEGEAIYRLLRWRDKGGIADLKKVIHTVELIIEYEEGRKL